MRRYLLLATLAAAGCNQGAGEKASLTRLSHSGPLPPPASATLDVSGDWRERTRIIEDTCGFGAWRGYRQTIFNVAQVGEDLAVDSLSLYREPFMSGIGSADRRRVEFHLSRHQLQQPPGCYVDFDQQTVATLGSDEMHGQQVVTYTATGDCDLRQFIPTGNNPCRLTGQFDLWRCAPGECLEGRRPRPGAKSPLRLDETVLFGPSGGP